MFDSAEAKIKEIEYINSWNDCIRIYWKYKKSALWEKKMADFHLAKMKINEAGFWRVVK